MSPNSHEGAWSLRPVEGDPLSLPWLWLGGWSLGGEGFGPHDERAARRTVEYALHVGIRHFDTAGFYAQGRSEALLAKTLRGRRREVFLSSKGGLVRDGSRVWHDASPAALRRALEASLQRLQTDYLDLYQLHWPDPQVPVSESLDALRQFREEGLIRHWGVGNLSAEEVIALIEPGALIPHQVHFNPLHRSREILSAGYTGRRCINCIVSPLEQGLLADGPASRGVEALGKRDVRRRNPLFHSQKVRAWVDTFHSLVAERGLPRAAVILLWILAQREVDLVIVGARRIEQLEEVLQHRAILRCLELGAPQGERASWRASLASFLGERLWRHLESAVDSDASGAGA
ncbi:MAG: aldo/keto reductase [Gammaproteobacteria bacterium]